MGVNVYLSNLALKINHVFVHYQYLTWKMEKQMREKWTASFYLTLFSLSNKIAQIKCYFRTKTIYAQSNLWVNMKNYVIWDISITKRFKTRVRKRNLITNFPITARAETKLLYRNLFCSFRISAPGMYVYKEFKMVGIYRNFLGTT